MATSTRTGLWLMTYMSWKTVSKSVRLLCLLLTVLTVLTGANRHPSVEAQNAGQDDAHFTVAILAEQYCANNPQTRSVLLKLRLHLVNTSSSTFEVGFPFPIAVFVSRTLADLKAGRYEGTMHGPLIRARSAEATAEVENKRLLPGEDAETIEDYIQFFVPASPQAPPKNGVLGFGKHYLQVQTDVFPPGTNLFDANAISVVKRVVSDPVPVLIKETPANVPACSELFKGLPGQNDRTDQSLPR